MNYVAPERWLEHPCCEAKHEVDIGLAVTLPESPDNVSSVYLLGPIQNP